MRRTSPGRLKTRSDRRRRFSRRSCVCGFASIVVTKAVQLPLAPLSPPPGLVNVASAYSVLKRSTRSTLQGDRPFSKPPLSRILVPKGEGEAMHGGGVVVLVLVLVLLLLVFVVVPLIADCEPDGVLDGTGAVIVDGDIVLDGIKLAVKLCVVVVLEKRADVKPELARTDDTDAKLDVGLVGVCVSEGIVDSGAVDVIGRVSKAEPEPELDEPTSIPPGDEVKADAVLDAAMDGPGPVMVVSPEGCDTESPVVAVIRELGRTIELV